MKEHNTYGVADMFTGFIRRATMVIVATVVGVATLAAAPSDSTVQDITLRYRLNAGDKYVYKVITDQMVVNGYTARLQSRFQIQALGKDKYNNTRCRLRITSDNSRTIRPVYKTVGTSARFAGYRLWSQAGAYDAVMDALGRIVTGKVVSSDVVDVEESIGTTEPTLDMVSNNLRPDVLPEIAAMMVPNSQHTAPIHYGEQWRDTIYQNSHVTKIETVKVGEFREPEVLLDTIIRIHRLDTVQTINGRPTATISVLSEKHGAWGSGHTKSRTIMLRDINSGLVKSLSETAWNIRDNEEDLIYTSIAELAVDESSPLPVLEVMAE